MVPRKVMTEPDTYDPLAEDESFRGPLLRRWQREALDDWEDNNCCGVVEAITGIGKSLVGIAAIHQTVVRGVGRLC
jgi:RNA polymerase primary sigma factor